MNNTTRQHPRTMQQAWGPYTNSLLYPLPDKRGTPVQRVLGGLLAIAIGIVGAVMLVVWGLT